MIDSEVHSRSAYALISAMAGIAVWFAHFGGVYATQGFGCPILKDAIGPSHALTAVRFAIAMLSGISIVLLSGLLYAGYRRASENSTESGDDNSTPFNLNFMHYLQFAIAGLAMVAVLWTSLAAVVVPACTPVFF